MHDLDHAILNKLLELQKNQFSISCVL